MWTKLTAPVPRERVSRRGLLELLGERPSRKLTLIRAPAGWGKSTLLADWHASPDETRPFAWLALDREDNDPVRFWTYVVEALHTVKPEIGASSALLLRAPGVDLVDVMLPVLLNELATLDRPAVLVLDDYHLITNAGVHDGMVYLLEHLPDSLHLVLSARSEPPLPLPRLRARGELTDIDAERLSFSIDEADALLNDVHGLGLERDDVARLQARTEGWAAGLYLAALSMQGRDDLHGFVHAFAGDHRHVVDYLSTEVLGGQPAPVRVFLLHTSILARLCGPLCDAVTGTRGSAQTLDGIERSNFFLVPLDTRREWYRYHHLFGELLRHELDISEPELAPELHRRAAKWLLDAGSASEAIHHTIAAGDVGDASELIIDHWLEFRDRARPETVLAWLDALPGEAVEEDARLCLVKASTLLEAGRVEQAGSWLDAAERGAGALLAGPASVESGVAAYRAIIQYVLGDVGQIHDAARGALEREATGSAYWRSALLTISGASVFLGGDSGDAASRLEEAARLAKTSGHALALTHALGWCALAHADRGEWTRAAALVQDVEELLRERPDLREYFGTSMAHVARGMLLQREGRTGEADLAMLRATELARRGVSRLQIAHALVAHAEVKRELGDRDTTIALTGEARRMVETCPDPGALPEMVATAERALRTTSPIRPLEARKRAQSARSRDTKARAAAHPVEELSERELTVLRLLASELSQREIGGTLYLSLNTVKTHTRSIFRKLGTSNRAEAVGRARELGLL